MEMPRVDMLAWSVEGSSLEIVSLPMRMFAEGG